MQTQSTPDPPEDLTGHVIVCGLHGVGLRIVEQLHHAGVTVVVVDDDPDIRLVSVVRRWGIAQVSGSSRLPETLEQAGLANAVALVCVETDDLHTLETALLAREMRPDLRVVVQLRNPAVGRALVAVDVAVVDVAGLSAPSVVEACLQADAHDVQLGPWPFVAAQVVATRSGTLREIYGDLAPIAVAPAPRAHEQADVVICPGRDQPVRRGDRVTMMGTPQELLDAGLSWGVERLIGAAEPVGAARVVRRVLRAPRTLLASLMQAADRRMGIVVGALAALAAVSTTVLRLNYQEPGGEGMTILDAVYFTVETIGTVGYGDFYFRDQPWALRLWAIGLMIVGAMLFTVFFALLTNLLVSRRIEESLGRRRLTGLADHVIVVGLGSIGVEVVQRLHQAGTRVVVVEADEGNRYLSQVRALGVPVVTGDATGVDTLAAVNLDSARAVAVLTSDDLVNIETGLAVRDQLGDRWAEVPVVLRLFDRQLARTVERSFDFRFVRSTAALAAPWFVGAALGLDVLTTFYVGGSPLLVARLTVTPEGGLVGLSMLDLSARIRVVALDGAEGWQHPPRRDTRFGAGDIAYLVGPYDELLQVLRHDQGLPLPA